MNNTFKSIIIILLISFSSTSLFSQTDTTKTSSIDKKLANETGTIKGNYQIKANSKNFKAKTPVNFNLKSNKKLNVNTINKNLNQNKAISKNQNFLLEELPEDRDIIGKRYWGNKDVTHKKLSSKYSLGTVKSKTRTVKIECRDYSYVDGDRIKIYLNEKVISNNIGLKSNYYVVYVNLEQGYNRIDFQALNQGFSGPNTAELNLYDANGNLISSKEWALGTGQNATLGVLYY